MLMESMSSCARVCVPTGLYGPVSDSKPLTDQLLKPQVCIFTKPKNGKPNKNHKASAVRASADMHQQIIVTILVVFIIDHLLSQIHENVDKRLYSCADDEYDPRDIPCSRSKAYNEVQAHDHSP